MFYVPLQMTVMPVLSVFVFLSDLSYMEILKLIEHNGQHTMTFYTIFLCHLYHLYHLFILFIPSDPLNCEGAYSNLKLQKL